MPRGSTDELQHVVRVCRRVHLRQHVSDLAVLVDHVGDALGVAVGCCLARTVGESDLPIGIAEEGEFVAELLGEGLVLGLGVEAAA